MKYFNKKNEFIFFDMLFIVLLFLLTYAPLSAQKLGKMPLADHSAAIHSNGIVYAWGNNSSGQIGDSTQTVRWLPVRVLKGNYEGTQYLGDSPSNPITEISLGGNFTIALAADGTIFSWGGNATGQLGDTTITYRLTPGRVLKGEYEGTTYLGDNPANPIIKIVSGFYFSLALALDGTVYSWGNNEHGQLGNNETEIKRTPIKVLCGEYIGTTFLGDNPNNKILDIAAGEYFSIALAEDGIVYSWGENNRGQLGDSTDTDRHTPIKVLKGAYSGTVYLGDDSNNKIIKIVAGDSHSLGLAEDGTAYNWGRNTDGQLGINSVANSYVPVRVLKGNYAGTTFLGDNPNNKIIGIAAGSFFSSALMEDGTLFNWGQNLNGQIGNDSTVNKRIPTHVLKGLYDGSMFLGDNSNNKIISIGLGDQHAIALAEDLTLYSWGDVTSGKLGDSLIVFHRTPGRVHGLNNVGFLILPVEETSNPIRDFELSHNYPNPFNPTTKIKYTVGETFYAPLSLVTLRVYDILGNEIVTLVNEEKSAGVYEIEFNANNFPSGVYFYKVNIGSFTETKKMVLLK
ncbi:MAG: T9SS type A sorting domain-containing protein [Ignavibacteriales bacterium]|nr:MAG: T9SS type A sorting domain-containing protein [Ignavibacteriales bacterium]